ncbi:ABC transporter substrate-binding protein [Mariprofundus erugo]|uniref:ABC transporter substrate-binding protein n=1 Tax=Mariprofundus erugo TaxID=2528639 RepID=A0A5R9GWL4_9PROT|nr:ABC transporter substrate-binding protein [Mariprofundus erugo]TLS68603.1 ABC transporter substrate-binding protein [Mariprofundus erugo]
MKMIRITFALLMALACALPAMASAEEGPRTVIEGTVNNIIHVLEARTDKTVISPEDREAIRHAIEGRFDYEAMASRSLGKPWKDLDAGERTRFTGIFRDLLEYSYGNRLSDYKGQKVEFDDAEIKGENARVKSKVIDGTRETPVEYRLHQTETGWQVYDIRIEGTSMVRTFYQDFQSQLDTGSYTDLVKSLETKIADLKAKAKG